MRQGERRFGRSSPRDQNESAFAAILADLLRRVPGARAAALVDRDGETVDYAGGRHPYDMKVAAAHLRIVLDDAHTQPSLGKPRWVLIRAARASLAVHSLPEGYALVLWMARGGGFRGLARSVPACLRRLADEAGWPPPVTPWHAVDVRLDPRGSPCGVALAADETSETSVEVLGLFRSRLPENERAWRVRAKNGVEFTLVLESTGFWYMDERLAV